MLQLYLCQLTLKCQRPVFSHIFSYCINSTSPNISGNFLYRHLALKLAYVHVYVWKRMKIV